MQICREEYLVNIGRVRFIEWIHFYVSELANADHWEEMYPNQWVKGMEMSNDL